ncbi:MAG: hypothetical protein HY293_22360 [Planctomycetes bacterium]|nr:hypothetical protein [Planctomycetota bacterium]
MPADLTTVLGRLLSDPALRAELRRDAAAAARSLDADPAEISALDVDGLERQAEMLVEKRLHEVGKLLPLTLAALGGEAAARFREHAALCWPGGHRRHAEDAAAFGRYLEARGLPRSRSELNRLRFAMRGGRISLGFVPDARVGGRPRRALQLLFRRRGAVRSWALTLGF